MRRPGPALVLAAVMAVAPAGADDDPSADRGKQIYLQGRGSGVEPVVALMGEARIEVPATVLPCASCHGRDGRGRPEGGVVPSDVTWGALTRPGAGDRPRPPYTERLVVRAVTLGLDSAGNRLDPVMPRYRMTRSDAADLVAYLRRLGEERDPGVEPATLRLGVLLPPDEPGSPHAAAATALRRVASAYPRVVDRHGGVYGRRLEIRLITLPAAPEERRDAVERFLEGERIFALVASFTAGADAALAELAADREVPLVGPLTLDVDDAFPMNPQVFHLYAGLRGQARALVRHAAAARLGGAAGPAAGRALILHAEDPLLSTAADAAADEAAAVGWGEVPRRAHPVGRLDPAAETRRWSVPDGIDDVFLLVSGEEAAALATAAGAAGWRGTLHAPGPLAGAALHGAGGVAGPGIVLAFPTLPRDRQPAALDRLHEELGDGAAADPVAGDQAIGGTEVAAWVAFELLTRALERVGRDVSRQGLVAALEELSGLPTGLTPPLTYGPNRRIGSRGSWVVEMNAEGPAAAPRVGWVPLD